MKRYSYKVGELRRMIKESSNEYKEVIGSGVRSTDKSNNDKSYSESKKRAKDFDGGLKEPEKKPVPQRGDMNKKVCDYNPIIEPDDRNKKRIQALEQGYNSELEQKNGIDKSADFDGNKNIVKSFQDDREESEKMKTDLQKSGLVASELPDADFEKRHLDERKQKAKRLTFKHTTFLNEAQMLSRIPEEYKKDGQVIYMKDKSDNEYVVECSYSQKSGIMEMNILSYSNKKLMNEQVNRIHELMGYSVEDGTRHSMTVAEKAQESGMMNEMLEISRGSKEVL